MNNSSMEWSPSPNRFKRRKNSVMAVEVRPDNADVLAVWCGGRMVTNQSPHEVVRLLDVPTLGGVVPAYNTDWIVCDEVGQYEVLSGREFKYRYEFHPSTKIHADQERFVFHKD